MRHRSLLRELLEFLAVALRRSLLTQELPPRAPEPEDERRRNGREVQEERAEERTDIKEARRAR